MGVPMWTRLAMGNSHSVHVLKNINMRVIAMTLHSHLNIGRTEDFDSMEERQLCTGGDDD